MSPGKRELSGRLRLQRPSVNWNRTSGSGIRTSLSGPRTEFANTTASAIDPLSTIQSEPLISPLPKAASQLQHTESGLQNINNSQYTAEQSASLTGPAFELPIPCNRASGEAVQQINQANNEDSLYGSPAKNTDARHSEADKSNSDDEILSNPDTESAALNAVSAPIQANLELTSHADGQGISDGAASARTSNHETAGSQLSHIIDVQDAILEQPDIANAIRNTTEDFCDPKSNERDSSEEREIATSVVEDVPATAAKNALQQTVDGTPFSMQLYIPSLARTTTEQDIRALFNGYPASRIEIRQVFGRPTNECYVQIASTSEAQRAVNELNGRFVHGRSIKVTFATTVSELVTASAKPFQSSPQFRSPSQSYPDSDTSRRDRFSDSESGEILDQSDEVSSINNMSFGSDRTSEDSSHEVIEISSDEDPMITDYSNASQPQKSINPEPVNKKIEVTDLDDDPNKDDPDFVGYDPSRSSPQILAELTPEQLRRQVIFWYPLRHPTTIPETDPVHCYVCNAIGHLTPWCPKRICAHCKIVDKHITMRCPTIARCPRCRERGHIVEKCPQKLRQEGLVVICNYCKEEGHVERDCELNWRTSGMIWKKQVPDWVPLSCLICGESGHLGNDCPIRPPGQKMASSMWSKHGLPRPFPTLSPLREAPPNNRKNKNRMPNPKARGIAAPAVKPLGGNRPSIPFASTNKPFSNRVYGRDKPAERPNIQIKGLANRVKIGASASSSPQRANYNQQLSQRQPALQQYFDSPNETPTLIRGRSNNQTRVRSRSPKGWYQSMPRAANSSQPRYRDRDEPRNYRPGR